MRRSTAIICIIFLLALAVRIYPLQQYHEWDESVYLQHAEHINNGRSNYDEFIFRPPVLPILIAGMYLLWHSHYAAQALIALLTASTVFGLFILGRRLHSEYAGTFAALLFAVHPLFVRFGHLIFTDALVGTFLVFSLCLIYRPGMLSAVGAGILAGIMSMTKFTGLGLLPFLAILVAYNEYRDGEKKTRRIWHDLRRYPRTMLFIAGTAAVITPYLVWSRIAYGGFFTTLTYAQEIVDLPISNPLFYAHHELFTAPLLIGLCGFAIYWKGWRHDRKVRAFAIFATASMAFLLVALTRFPYKHQRYGLLAIIALLILAGIGYAALVKALASRARWRHAAAITAAIIAAAIIILSAESVMRFAQPPMDGWKYEAIGVAQRIDALNTSYPIYAGADYPFYGYYTDHPVIVVDKYRFLEKYPGIMPDPGYFVARRDYTHPPTAQWADAQPNMRRLFDDGNISVYFYVPPNE